MPLGPMAYYEGEDRPRCPATPAAKDKRDEPPLGRGTWECALPEGHADFDNPRVRPHSWVQTGD